MKIKIVAVDGIKRKEIHALSLEYIKRIRSSFDVSVVEISSRSGRSRSTCTDSKLMRHMEGRQISVALSEEGEMISSMALSRFLENSAASGRDLCFVIGATDGLSATVKGAADKVFSLSAMTLTRDFARLLLLEQLYRAVRINRGEPYHR